MDDVIGIVRIPGGVREVKAGDPVCREAPYTIETGEATFLHGAPEDMPFSQKDRYRKRKRPAVRASTNPMAEAGQ